MRKHGEMQTAESFPLCKVRGADAGSRRRGDNNKSFHPFAPLEVTLAFSDQGPEYSKTVFSPFTRPTQ